MDNEPKLGTYVLGRVNGSITLKYISDEDELMEVKRPMKLSVPRYIYDWIAQCKEFGYTLLRGLQGSHDKRTQYWLHNGTQDEVVNKHKLFGKAWLAYPHVEIGEEPLYYVRMPNTDDYLTLESGKLNFQEWLGKTPTSIKQLFTRHELEKYDKIYWGHATLAEGVDRQ